MARELLGDVLGGRRMAREIGEHVAALLGTGGGIVFAKHDLIARFVQAVDEDKFAAVLGHAWLDPGPAGEHVGKAGDVLLRIAATDAERMQFEDFAGEIFVQTFVAVDAVDRIRSHRFDVVEIDEHRRMTFDRREQIGEAAEHMRPDRFAFVRAGRRVDFSADTQKWFDQNHTRRSTKPISALTAALIRAAASC